MLNTILHRVYKVKVFLIFFFFNFSGETVAAFEIPHRLHFKKGGFDWLHNAVCNLGKRLFFLGWPSPVLYSIPYACGQTVPPVVWTCWAAGPPESGPVAATAVAAVTAATATAAVVGRMCCCLWSTRPGCPSSCSSSRPTSSWWTR